MQYDDYADLDTDPEAVLALFTSREYFERKYDNLGARDVEVLDCTDDGNRFEIKVQLLEPPNKPIPAFLRKVTGEWIAMTRKDIWERSSRKGRLDIRIEKAPVSIDADMHLEALAAGTRLHMHFNIQARVPVVAGRIEKFLADDLIGRFRADMAETRRLLPQFVDA